MHANKGPDVFKCPLACTIIVVEVTTVYAFSQMHTAHMQFRKIRPLAPNSALKYVLFIAPIGFNVVYESAVQACRV